MNIKELAVRRNFDFRVLSAMRCPTFDFTAYRGIGDLDRQQHNITDLADTSVSKYRFMIRVRTHVGPRSFSDQTEIGVDSEVPDYPRKPPRTWILSAQTPWSPHFMAGGPVCIGPEFWEPAKGHITLGHLVVHLCYLLNWDEKGRGPGYVGWNGEAVRYHREKYKNSPINPGISYPVLPAWLSGSEEVKPAFQVLSGSARPDHGFQVL